MTKRVAFCVQIPEDVDIIIKNLSASLKQSKTQILTNAIRSYASSSSNIVKQEDESDNKDIKVYSLEEIILSAPRELNLIDTIKEKYNGEISGEIVSKVFEHVSRMGQLTTKTVVFKVLSSKDWMIE